MNTAYFLQNIQQIPPATAGSGDGFRYDRPVNVHRAYLASSGAPLTTTLTTNPGWIISSNQLCLRWNAAIVVAAGLQLQVPGNYDEKADDLRIRMLTIMGGATDTPTITVAGYRLRAAGTPTALTSKTGVSPGTTTALPPGAAYAWNEFNFSGQGLKPNDTLTLSITPGTHGTDTLDVASIVLRYKSMLVLGNWSERF